MDNIKLDFKASRLVSIDDLDIQDINTLYYTTQEFRKILERPLKKVPALKELTIANLFFEDSTRTRLSFELAEKRLSADIVNFTSSNSSLKKGETLNDTVQNLLKMKIDLIVIRNKISGTAHFVHKKTRIPVINAGDGTNEHPTQALLDLFTLWNKGFKTEDLKIHLKGDIIHSRVAGSSLKLWDKLGIEYEVTGPKTVQRQFLGKRSKIFNSNRPYNIQYNLRIQKERQDKELIPNLEEYNQFFGSKDNTLDRFYILHPGPINRGVELDSELADAPNSLILDQVETGVALRMALIYFLGQKKGENKFPFNKNNLTF
jgi:aspartate carbamoyltransferase catalytic subunit